MSILNAPHIRRQCAKCSNWFRAVAWSEYVGDLVIGVVIVLPFILAEEDWLSWPVALALAATAVLLIVFIWPYVTIFEKVDAARQPE